MCDGASGRSQFSVAAPFSTVPLPHWTSDDVAEWSRSIGEADLATRLTSNNVTGQDLQTLTEMELQDDFGVDDAEQHTIILEGFRRVQNRAHHAQQLPDPHAKRHWGSQKEATPSAKKHELV